MQDIILAEKAVFVQDGQPVTTSRKVAETFGKRHDNVLQAIRELIEQEPGCLLNFQESFFVQKMPQGGIRKQPYFTITRDGFVLLAMGFTGTKALAFKIRYIEAFNAMEQALRQNEANAREQMRLTASNIRNELNTMLDVVDMELFKGFRCFRMPNGFRIPEVEMVRAYCNRANLTHVDPEEFCAYYNARNWTQGKKAVPMEDWTVVVEQWEARRTRSLPPCVAASGALITMSAEVVEDVRNANRKS